MSPRYLLARPWLFARQAGKFLSAEAPSLRFLLFHDVMPAERPAFETLLHWLSTTGRLTTPAEARAVLSGEASLTADKVLLTFDDGFAGNLSLAQTLLARYGATAIFFVCPGLMALRGDAQRQAIAANIFDGRRTATDLPAECGLMDWDAVERLRHMGHEIANHTLSHRRLSALSADEAAAEIGGGAAAMAQRLGAAGDWFAFPFGDIASVTAGSLTSVGRHHLFCRSGVRGGNRANTHPLAVLADHVDLAAPWSYQRLVIEGGLDPLYRRQRHDLARMAASRHGD